MYASLTAPQQVEFIRSVIIQTLIDARGTDAAQSYAQNSPSTCAGSILLRDLGGDGLCNRLSEITGSIIPSDTIHGYASLMAAMRDILTGYPYIVDIFNKNTNEFYSPLTIAWGIKIGEFNGTYDKGDMALEIMIAQFCEEIDVDYLTTFKDAERQAAEEEIARKKIEAAYKHPLVKNISTKIKSFDAEITALDASIKEFMTELEALNATRNKLADKRAVLAGAREGVIRTIEE